MGPDNLEEQDMGDDLEIGGIILNEDTRTTQEERLLTEPSIVVLGMDELVGDEKGGVNSYRNWGIPVGFPRENANFGGRGGEREPLLKQNYSEGKKDRAHLNNASKPPRPPKGPSLDAADLILIREMSSIAMKKRARNERIKELKKMNMAAKPSSPSCSSSSSILSSSGTLFALIVTLFFCVLLIFKGNSMGLAIARIRNMQSQNRKEHVFHTGGSFIYNFLSMN